MPIAGPMAHMGAAHGMRAHHGRHAYQARGAYVPLHQSAYLTSALPEVAVQVLDRLAYCYMNEDSTIECGEY